MSYGDADDPSISSDVRIILVSAARYTDQLVLRPGGKGSKVPFGSLSVTGGVVNAYNAIRMAEQASVVRP